MYAPRHGVYTRWWRVRIVLTRRYIEDHEGQNLMWYKPWHYRFGYAYTDYERDNRIYWIVPLNVFVAVGRVMFHWIWINLGYKLDGIQRSRVWMRGYRQGLEEGKVIGAADIMSKIEHGRELKAFNARNFPFSGASDG